MSTDQKPTAADDASTRPSFDLGKFGEKALDPPCKILLPHNLTEEQFNKLLRPPEIQEEDGPVIPAFGFTALRDWLTKLLANLELQKNEAHTFSKHPYKLRQIEVQAADWFWTNKKKEARGNPDEPESKLGFLKIQALVTTDKYIHKEGEDPRADWVPGAVFLRGGSVAILVIVQSERAKGDEEKYAILTIQPRIAGGSLAFAEIPAGMLDGNGSFKGTAAKELGEEANLTVEEKDLINMSELATRQVRLSPWKAENDESLPGEIVEDCMYPSIGACDEFMALFLCQKRLTERHLNWLRGRATGLRKEGENITLKLVLLQDLWKEGGRDAKALTALALYESLKRSGQIKDIPEAVEPEPENL